MHGEADDPLSALSDLPDLSLYVLDIAKNSVRAGASSIAIRLTEAGEWLRFTVIDNGCGMTAEQVKMAREPSYTTRTTRRVGMGIPLLIRLAESSGGSVQITSVPKGQSSEHGTTVTAFLYRAKDFPLGDMAATVATLIQGSPEIHFTYTHDTERGRVLLDTNELHAILGEQISLAEPQILLWITAELRLQYENPGFH